jgi:hypothetical protein
MAKGSKNFQSKSAGPQAVKGGPSGGMHKFKGVGPQAPGGSAVAAGDTGGKFAKAGPSGKMQKFTPVKPQKPGVSSVTNSGGGSYAKGK